MRVLITSTRTPHALAAVRSFGQKGWEVTAGDSASLSAGKFSKFTTKRLRYPSMSDNPQGFVEALLREVAATKYDLIFPTFEETFILSRFKDIFSRYTTLLLPDYDLLMTLHHKGSLTDHCRRIGVPTPPTWHPVDLESFEAIKDVIPLPAVIKLPDVNNSLGLTLVDTREELVKSYKKLVRFFRLSGRRMPMIQKRIDGQLLFSLFLANQGETVGSLIYKPLTMFPDGGGTAFYRESLRHPVAEELGKKLIADLKWHGFLGFDFILDPDTGQPYLIDANPRTNPAFQTGEAAGVDFTQMAADIVAGKSPTPNLEPKAGIRSKTLFVEIIWWCFQFLPGKNWGKRIKSAFSVFRKRDFIPDVHRKYDRLPSLILGLYVPWFMFVINAVKPRTGGYCYGCNYNMDTASKLDQEKLQHFVETLEKDKAE